MRYELRYDLRNPTPWQRPWDDHYRAFLDQVAWADRNDFAAVHLHEHHFSDDGYLPSPFVAAAAIAARTERIRISLSVVLLPLRHPVQVAEEAALVDVVSGGRLDLMVGAGSRPEEFAGYGVALSDRASLMEEGVEIVRRCWEEDEVSFRGRHWTLDGVRVRPQPLQDPRPRILMGGSSPAAARRAARVADGFIPPTSAVLEIWRDEVRARGKDPSNQLAYPMTPDIGPRNFLHVAKDPDEAWNVIAPHAVYEASSYARWAGSDRSVYEPVGDATELRASGMYGVHSPDETVGIGREMQRSTERPRLVFHPMMGGMPIDLGQEGLELVVDEVMAQLPPTKPEVRPMRAG